MRSALSRTPAPALSATDLAIKVPAVTAGFWLIKILATTLGETDGDALSMSLGWGYAASSMAFMACFALAVWLQMRATQFNPWRYWAVIIASTTVGTTLADLADRDLGIGYAGGSLLLAGLLAFTLWQWRRQLGSVAVTSVTGPRAEGFYWLTIMFSQTLGTALGDWAADSAGLGYLGAAAVFAAGLALLALTYRTTAVSRTLLFWMTFVLTRPLGAVVGDFLDKPLDHGGLALSRFAASGLLLAAIAVLIAWLPQRPAAHPH